MTDPLPTVRAVCVYADVQGQSHLADVDLPALAQVTDADGRTLFVGSTGATVMGFVVDASHTGKDWHRASMAGLSIVLSGSWEIEAGSGDRRLLETGSVLLMLDTEGQGHRSRTPGDTGCTVLGVGIDEDTRAAFAQLVPQAA
jgi:hypothetical protein